MVRFENGTIIMGAQALEVYRAISDLKARAAQEFANGRQENEITERFQFKYLVTDEVIKDVKQALNMRGWTRTELDNLSERWGMKVTREDGFQVTYVTVYKIGA